MSCTPPVRTLSFPVTIAFSKGGSAPNQGVSDIFVVTDDAFMQIAPLLKAIRVTLVVNNRSENAEVQVVLQPTDNGCTWGADSVLLAYTPRSSGRRRAPGSPTRPSSSAASVSA